MTTIITTEGKTMIYLWTNCDGGELTFKDRETALLRCRYRGESDTPGVSMWDVNGRRYFSKDLWA